MPKENSSAPTSRELAAILFADIEGYTSLMQQDESEALEILNRYQQVSEEFATNNNGEIIKSYGDGSIMLFKSSINAVQCAYEMQIAFREVPLVPLRVGIHIGEVVRKDNDIFGNGVNIASRIESLGVPQSVLFSRDVQEKIKNQIQLTTVSLGKFEFKNVEDKIEVFALANEGFVVPKRADITGKLKTEKKSSKLLPYLLGLAIVAMGIWFIANGNLAQSPNDQIIDKSIAVIPFKNLNQNPEQDYFSDGISQDILTNLSGIKDLLVISFNSSKQYRDSPQTSRQIGEALGVKHLLSGSVQQSGDQLRIRAMLVDSKTDQQLWAKAFDMKLEDIFTIQSQVSNEIADVLKAELLPEVAKRINAEPTQNFEAWQKYAQGRQFWELRGQDNLRMAEGLFLSAIDLDSTFAQAYAALAQTYIIFGIHNSSFLPKSKDLAERALRLDENIADAYSALGEYYYRSRCDFKNAIPNNKRAIELEPGNATAHQWYSEVLITKGDIENGIKHIEIAKKLDPASRIVELMGLIYLLTENKYQEGLLEFEKFYGSSPEINPISYFLTILYARLGVYEKAWTTDLPDLIKEFVIYQAQGDKAKLLDLKGRMEDTGVFSKESFQYQIDTELALLNGEIEIYIDRLETGFFDNGYEALSIYQLFPLPDSIRLHPKFQDMMLRHDFTIRPRSKRLDELRAENLK